MLHAQAAGFTAALEAASGVTPDERQRRQLEQLRERYARDELTTAQLELETGRVLGIPEPPRSYGTLVHVAVTAAGVVALLAKWRRKGSRWVL